MKVLGAQAGGIGRRHGGFVGEAEVHPSYLRVIVSHQPEGKLADGRGGAQAVL